MNPATSAEPVPTSDRLLGAAIFTLAAAGAAGWAGACLAAAVSGQPPLPPATLPPFAALARPTHPWAAWGRPPGSAAVYWSCTLLTVLVLVAGAAATTALVLRHRVEPSHDPRRLPGLASRSELEHAAGRRALLKRGRDLRPTLARPTCGDLGHRLGRAGRTACYCSVEDSLVILGPPRAGKGLHLVIPLILDAPGAVLTTSTRPDNLTTTLTTRQGRGPVAVFDPQGLAGELPSATRWSPVRGCEHPHTALVRAKAFTAGTANGTADATFWQSSAEQAVRCLLHAAAVAGRDATDLYRWSLSAVQAREAVMILASHPDAAPGWHQALEAITVADPRQRDSVWAMVALAFAAFADPRVLDAVTPTGDDAFDPESFITSRGTVYLLGTSTGAAATAGLVGAFVEDVLEAARRAAATSPGARLDPPLTLVLDEAANYPLPSLGSLMSDGGGTGISTAVVLQSLAQARAVWGEHQAGAIWDAAVVKIVLGGGSNARDLEDLSRLIGQRRERQTSTSNGGTRTSITTSTRDVPVMEASRLRTLPFGTAVLLLRSARPAVLTLRPWTARADGAPLARQRRTLEETIRQSALRNGGSHPIRGRRDGGRSE